MVPFIATWLLGCAGFVGDSGFCPELPEDEIGLDEPILGFDLSVRAMGMFAASPVRTSLEYEDGLSTGLSVRIDPVQALVRSARNPVLIESELRCEEIVATFDVELFSDDGTLAWAGRHTRLFEDPEDADRLVISVPFASNLGEPDRALARRMTAFLDEHPELAPESLKPVAYQLDLDLTTRDAAGTLTFVMTHDPVPETVTEWVLGTF